MRRSSLTAVALALALSALAPSLALAYCRTSSCAAKGSTSAVTGSVCNPSQPTTDCGTPLAWPNPCVSYSLQKDASKGVSFDVADAMFRKAFATWTSAPCPGGGTPRISVKELDPTECALHEYNQKAGNANNIIFRDDGWPYAGSVNTLALTTVTYNIDDGQIFDADMELNSTDAEFTTGDASVMTDLLSVLTHETGHFLGLAHSVDPTATMYPMYTLGDTSLRDISPDDIEGICAIYPPGAVIPKDCDPTPRHGFSTLCAADQTAAPPAGCCAIAPGLPGGAGSVAGAVALLGAALLGARRQRRAGSRP